MENIRTKVYPRIYAIKYSIKVASYLSDSWIGLFNKWIGDIRRSYEEKINIIYVLPWSQC